MKTKPSFKDIVDAKNRISKFIVDTPIISSSILNDWLGHNIYFKADSFQKIGAFKSRGASNAISWLIEEDKKPKKTITIIEDNVETEQEIYTIDSEGNLIKKDAPAPQNVINILDNVG